MSAEGNINVAANLADCFRLNTGIATAMVDYPIGDLIAERVRAMGVKPFYKRFKHNGVNGPNMATVYSDRGYGVRAPGGVLQSLERGCRSTQTRGFRLECHFSDLAYAGFTAGASFRRFRRPPVNSSSKA